jgi:hypothetical protein
LYLAGFTQEEIAEQQTTNHTNDTKFNHIARGKRRTETGQETKADSP